MEKTNLDDLNKTPKVSLRTKGFLQIHPTTPHEHNFRCQDILQTEYNHMRGIHHGHSGPVRSIIISSDSQFFISSSSDTSILIWSMLTRKTYSTLSGHLDEVICLSINKDNSKLVSGSLDKTARIWDLHTKACLQVLFHNSPINSVDIRDCQEIILTTADDGGLYIWDFVGELVKKIDICQRNCVKGKFFIESEFVLTWAKEQSVMVWNWKEKVLERTLDKHEGNIVDAAICLDGYHFAVCEERLRIYIWSIFSWSIEKIIKINDTIMSLTYSHDGKYLAHTFGSGYYTTLWDLENTHQIKTIMNYPNKMNCLAITNDLEVVIEGSEDKIICVTYFNDKIRPNVLAEETNNISDMVLSKSNNLILNGAGNCAKIIDLESGEVRLCISTDVLVNKDIIYDNEVKVPIRDSNFDMKNFSIIDNLNDGENEQVSIEMTEAISLALTSDDKILATGHTDGTIRLWDFDDIQIIGIIKYHKGPVTCLLFDPSNTLLISGSSDSLISCWNISDCKTQFILSSHKKEITSLSLSLSGHNLISCSQDCLLKIWDLQTTIEIFSMQSYTPIIEACFSYCEKYFLTTSIDNKIRIWNLATKKEEFCLAGHTNRVKKLIVMVNNKYIISGSYDKSIRFWDFYNKTEISVLKSHTGHIRDLVLTPDERLLISSGDDGFIIIWDVINKYLQTMSKIHVGKVCKILLTNSLDYIISTSDDKHIKLWSFNNKTIEVYIQKSYDNITAVCLSANSRLAIFAIGACAVVVYDIEENVEKYYFEGHSQIVKCLDFSEEGNVIGSGSVDMSVKIWNLDDEDLECSLEGHNDIVTAVRFVLNAKFLLSCSFDGVIKMWNLLSQTEVYCFVRHADHINCMDVAVEKKLIFSGSSDKTVKIWNMNDRKIDVTYTENNHSVASIAVSSKENYAVWSSLNIIVIWSINNKSVVYKFCDMLEQEVKKVLISSSSDLIFTCSSENIIRKWDFSSRTKIASLKTTNEGAYRSLIFSFDKTLLISGKENGEIKIWDTRSKKVKYFFYGHSGQVRALAATKNNNYCISGSEDKLIKIWNLNKNRLSNTLTGHNSEIWSLSFIKNDSAILSSSLDSYIKIWDFKTRTQSLSFKCEIIELNLVLPYSSDKRLFLCSSEKSIKSLNLEKQSIEFKLSGHKDSVRNLIINTNEDKLYSSSRDKTVRVWNILTRSMIFTLETTQPVFSMLLLDNEKYLVAGYWHSGYIQIWDLYEHKEAYKFKAHKNSVNFLAKYSENEYASCSYDETVKLWNIVSNTEIWTIQPCLSTVTNITTDKKYVYTAGSNGHIEIYNVDDNYIETTLIGHKGKINTILVTKDSKMLITSSEDNSIRFWDLTSKKHVSTITEKKTTILSTILTLNEDMLIAGMQDGIIKLWRISDKTEAFTLSGHKSAVKSLAIANDNIILISGSEDFTIRLWNILKKSELKSLTSHKGPIEKVLMIQKGKYFSSCSQDGLIKIWSVEKMRENFTLSGHQGSVKSIVETPDDKFLITGSLDGTVRFWNFKERREEFCFNTESFLYLAICTDGKSLISCSETEFLTIWKLRNRPYIGISQGKINNSIDVHGFYTHNNICFVDCFIGEKPSSLCSDYALKSITDPYCQDMFEYLNAKDSVKNKNFANLLPKSISLCISRFGFTPLHFLCLVGNTEQLRKVAEKKFIIKTDVFGKTPFYYAIAKKNLSCVEILIDYLIKLFDNPNCSEFTSSLCSIKNDFSLIIRTSPSNFYILAQKLLISSPAQFIKSSLSLPKTIFSDTFVPSPNDFSSKKSQEDIENPIIIKYSLFELPSSVGSKENIKLLEAINTCSDQRIYNAPLIQEIIDYQWNYVRIFTGLYSFLLFINIMLMLIVVKDMSHSNQIIVGFFFAVNALLFLWELGQVYFMKFDYFKDIWNYIDISRFALSIVWIITISKDRYSLTWVVVLLNFIRGLTAFRLFDGTRHYVRLIYRALNDIKYFIILFSYSILTFGALFTITGQENATFKSLWFDAYGLNFGLYDTRTEYAGLEYTVYIGATFINIVLMLNLLISILGDSHEQFQLDKSIIDYKEKLDLCLEVEKIMFWKRNDFIMKYLHVMTDVMNFTESSAWEGRISYLEKKIDKSISQGNQNYDKICECILKQLEKTRGAIESDIDKKMLPIKNDVEEGKKKFEEILKRMEKMEEMLMNIGDRLKN